MRQNEVKEELIKLKNELSNKDLGSFKYGSGGKLEKEKKYIYKVCGNYQILILESDNEMGARIEVEILNSKKAGKLNILSKEIINLVEEINKKIKTIWKIVLVKNK